MGITYLGTRDIQISELKKEEVVFIEVSPEVQQKEYVNHHILLADVSGSMSGNIRSLKERLKMTLDALLLIPNSYVSIITYSGDRQSKRILNAVKCDSMTFAMNKVNDVLDKELYTKGVTVMSEPLEESIKICKELVGVADKHHICLFTDGCLVPSSWSEAEERKKCFAVAEICKKENIFLNAIGFSMYYDKKFLKQLIEIAGNGALMHIDKIESYSQVILDTIKKVNAADMITTTVEAKVEGMKLFNLSTSMFSTNLVLSGKSVIALIGGTEYKVNDDNMRIGERSNAKDELVDDFLYSLARHYSIEENVDDYEFIVMALGDTALFDVTQSCYSFIEKGNAVSKVTEVYEDKSKRFAKGRNPITYSVANEPLCVLEILKMIMDDEDSTLFWDLQTPYHKITMATKNNEDNVKFTRQESGLVPVTSLDIGSEKLNIGIKVRIPGKVTDEVSKFSMDACVYRGYNIINGGNLNVPYLIVKPSKEVYEKLNAQGLLSVNTKFSFAGGTPIFTIDLNGVKSANKRLLKSMTFSEILANMKSIADAKCKNWALGQLIKQITEGKEKVEFSKDLTMEEIELRKILRIDEKGIYQPLSVEKDTETPVDIYPAIFYSWDVKFPDKKVKEKYLTDLTQAFMPNGRVSDDTYDKLNILLEVSRNEMRSKELAVNCVRLASAIIGKSPWIWDAELEKDKKKTNKLLNQNMIVGGKMTVFKKALEVTEDVIECQKWIELIPCS